MSPRPRSWPARIAVAAVALLLGGACGASEPAGQPDDAEPAAPTRLTVALDWFPNPDHVGLYYALDKGFWAERGLEVELKTPSDPSAGLKLVSAGDFDLAIYYTADTFFAAEQGIPVVAVASLVPVTLNSLISLGDSDVTGPGDLAGATIGVSGLPFDDAVVKTLREAQGLDGDEVKVVNVGFNLEPSLLTRRVDAIIGAYFNIEATSIEIKTGEPPNVIRLEELGVPAYDELVVVANADRLRSDASYRDAVRRFVAGMVEGVEGAQADEAGSIALMREETDYTAEEIAGMVPDTLPLLTPPEGRPVGCLDLEAWRAFGEWMVDKTLLEAPVDVSAIATNDYHRGC